MYCIHDECLTCFVIIFFASNNLTIYIDAAVKTVLKRLDFSSETLGAVGVHSNSCLLKELLPKGYKEAVFPLRDEEVPTLPLVKGKYNAQLHRAIGLLRQFDCVKNNPVPSEPPQCSFYSREGLFIQGEAILPPYGPIFFEILYCVAKALGGLYARHIATVKSANEVEPAIRFEVNRRVCAYCWSAARLMSDLPVF